MLFIVQGSSRSWAEDKDHCMYEIDGKPAIYHTIKRIYDNFQYCSVIVIAPEFDKDEELEFLKNLVNQYFHIVKIMGIKAGKIHFDDDPIGPNTVMILQKI